MRLYALRAAVAAHLARRHLAGDLDALGPAHGGAGPISNRAAACRRDIPHRIAFITFSRRSIDSATIPSQPLAPLNADQRSA